MVGQLETWFGRPKKGGVGGGLRNGGEGGSLARPHSESDFNDSEEPEFSWDNLDDNTVNELFEKMLVSLITFFMLHSALQEKKEPLRTHPMMTKKEMLRYHGSYFKNHDRLQHECIRCLRAIMNNTVGLKMVFQQQDALMVIARSLDASKQSVMYEAAKLLAAVCLVQPNGHEIALAAIATSGELRRKERFTPIIDGLLIKSNDALRVVCMQLINAIVTTPDDMDFRIHLRNEFMRMGLSDALELLSKDASEDLVKQVKIFQENREEDYEEFMQRFDNVRLELDDPVDCFDVLKNLVTDTPSEPYFLSILQHLLFIRDDTLISLAERFSSKPPKTLDGTDSKSGDPSASSTSGKKVKDLKVLDGKSAQNLSILLGGSLKHMSYRNVQRCILRCDDSLLSGSVLDQLIAYLPPPDQLKKLEEYKDRYDELTEAEQFAVTIAEVKRLLPRLKSMSFKQHYAEMVQDIKPDIVAGTAACEEIKQSKKFANVLELILLIGNYMNTGSRNAQAFGFEISYLPKLSSTKDVENKMTLLHFLVETVEKKFPELINFGEELAHVDRAARVSTDSLQKALRLMDSSIRNLEMDLANSKVPQGEDDLFAQVMGVSFHCKVYMQKRMGIFGKGLGVALLCFVSDDGRQSSNLFKIT
ncbi:hypothetical protein J437_LFUL007738 [Ladona fulva]|uniref:Uncharacterized protein n=1 Tax=Ladona fulva TaxID=123851 RepID=A0A8K0KH50_LADFU|nr:hypothetical protein J437_LFUL007738 [Ladona fulva]